MVGGGRLIGITAQFSFFCFFGVVAKNGLYFHIVHGTASSLFLNYMLQ